MTYLFIIFQELFNVSKNTVLKDVRNLRMKLQEEDIRLIYSRKKGLLHRWR